MNHIDMTFENDQMLECFSTVGTLMWPFSHMIDYGKNRIFSGILLSGRLVNQEKVYFLRENFASEERKKNRSQEIKVYPEHVFP